MRKYEFKTPPRKYQVRALQKVVKRGGGGLFMPMRSGKSKVAVDWAAAMNLKHGVRRVMVVTHTPTTFGVWRNEIRKHCPLPYTVSVQEPPPNALTIQFLIINVQRMYSRERVKRGKNSWGWEMVRNEMLYDWKPEAIIVDESTAIGDPGAEQSRKLYRLQKDLNVKYKLILSGTPLHRKLFMAFGQFKFLDDTLFGTSFGAFKTEYGLWGGYGKRTLLKYINVKRFRRKIEPYIYQMQHVPLVPPVHQVIPVELEPKARRLYDQMGLERVAHMEDGETVEAPLIVTQLLKQAQLASGFVRSNSGKWYRTSHAKRLAYGDRLQDYREAGKHKIIVFSRFLPTLRDIAQESRARGYRVLLLHGGVKHEDRERAYVKFNEAPGRWVFVSQISTGSMGIDLSAADTTLYYSLTESLLHYDQSMARQRRYRDTRTLSYDYLLASGTVDELMYLALQEKMSLVDLVLKHPDLVHWKEPG